MKVFGVITHLYETECLKKIYENKLIFLQKNKGTRKHIKVEFSRFVIMRVGLLLFEEKNEYCVLILF